MALVAAGVLLRDLPGRLLAWLGRLTTMSVTVKDDDLAFVWVKEWLLEQDFARRARRVDLDTSMRGAELALMPAPGLHWFWREGRPFRVFYARSHDTKGRSERRLESLTFRTLGRGRAVLRRFVDDIAAAHKRRAVEASRFYAYNDGWDLALGYRPRCLESVILAAGEKEALLGDVERFLGGRERYRRLGVPYHRGYLFYGPPGTGKTSLVSGLADHFRLSIFGLNLSEMTDRSLKAAMRDVPAHSLLLFEDIDCMTAAGRRGARAPGVARLGVTLSGLLNALDGFDAPQETIFAMTTNAMETLDAALLRPGRIDYRLYLGAASEAQKAALHRRFFPDADEEAGLRFARAHAGATMAECQNALLGGGAAECAPTNL